MTILTLIPEAENYGIAILAAAGLGSFNIAAHLHRRWLSEHTSGLAFASLVVNSGILIWGFLLIPPAALFATGPVQLAASAVFGAAVGWASFRTDLALGRRLVRRDRGPARQRATPARRLSPSRVQSVRRIGLPTQSSAGKKRAEPRNGRLVKFSTDLTTQRFETWQVVLIAIQEELIFRGFLVYLCLTLANPLWTATGLAAVTVAFCASHIAHGWRHALGKAPLSLATLVLVLATGTVYGAIVCHVTFNLLVMLTSTRTTVLPSLAGQGRG